MAYTHMNSKEKREIIDLTKRWSMSVKTVTLQENWKLANVIAFFKKVIQKRYRPVGLMSVLDTSVKAVIKME